MSIIDTINKNLKRAPLPIEREIAYDLVFVVNINSRGWILEKICNIIAENGDVHSTVIFTERNDKLTLGLPPARAYFFSHYNLYVSALATQPSVSSALRFVWFTHPAPGRYSMEEIAEALRHVTVAFTANTHHASMLNKLGVPSSQIATILGGADPDLFTYKVRGSKKVAFISAYYPRKNPDLMLDVIRRMPDTHFVLVGPSPDEVENSGLLWSSWRRYDELKALPNLEILAAKYEDFPKYLNDLDVYVSLSNLEGGPIPLIEALFANMIPVVTKTGFAEDIVEDGKNGHLLEIDCSASEVVGKIKLAQSDTVTDVRTPALAWSWQNFGKSFWPYIFPRLGSGDKISFSDTDNVKRYCREGFGSKETNGILLASLRANLDIPVREIPGQSKILVAFRIKPLPEAKQCHVEIALGGVPLGSRYFDASKQHEFLCELPQSVGDAERLSLSITTSTGPGCTVESPFFRLDAIQVYR